MITSIVHLYLLSEETTAFLRKEIDFPVLPRTDEWIKLKNEEMGNYFAFKIYEVTHREGALTELTLQPLMSGSNYDYFSKKELVEYIASYTSQGWEHVSSSRNTTFKNEL